MDGTHAGALLEDDELNHDSRHASREPPDIEQATSGKQRPGLTFLRSYSMMAKTSVHHYSGTNVSLLP